MHAPFVVPVVFLVGLLALVPVAAAGPPTAVERRAALLLRQARQGRALASGKEDCLQQLPRCASKLASSISFQPVDDGKGYCLYQPDESTSQVCYDGQAQTCRNDAYDDPVCGVRLTRCTVGSDGRCHWDIGDSNIVTCPPAPECREGATRVCPGKPEVCTQVMQRNTNNRLDWGPCTCPAVGTTRPCLTGNPLCPSGVQTFSGDAWGACTPDLLCQCQPGTQAACTCSNGAAGKKLCNGRGGYDACACDCPGGTVRCGGTCTSQVACAPGMTRTASCGQCGTRTDACNDQCQWTQGACRGEGACAPGTSRAQPCERCGTRVDFCSNTCAWQVGACAGQGACAPGEKRTVSCGACGQQQDTCTAACQWFAGTCQPGHGACRPGATRVVYCGPIGIKKIDICTAACQWGLSGCSSEPQPCLGRGACRPGATRVVACALGQKRIEECSEQCQWVATAPCGGLVLCTPGERRSCAEQCCGRLYPSSQTCLSGGAWGPCLKPIQCAKPCLSDGKDEPIPPGRRAATPGEPR